MSEVLHIIGVCPDSLSHMDLLDFVAYNYNETISVLRMAIDFFKFK